MGQTRTDEFRKDAVRIWRENRILKDLSRTRKQSGGLFSRRMGTS